MLQTAISFQLSEDLLHRNKSSSLPYPDDDGLFCSETLYPPPLTCRAQIPTYPQCKSQLYRAPLYPQYPTQACSAQMPSQPTYKTPLYRAPVPSDPPYPPQPDHSQTPLRAFEVQFANGTSTHIRVAETGEEDSVLYTADFNIQGPHLTFKGRSTESTIATVDFRCSTPEIEICLNGKNTTLNVEGDPELETTYDSAAFENARLSWKNRGASEAFDFECLDENSTPLARFTADSSRSKTRTGQLELFGKKAISGAALDEVVVTGLALAHYSLAQVNTIDTAT